MKTAILATALATLMAASPALAETLKEFTDIRRGRPITEEEFENAKDGILQGFPSQFETQSQILQQLVRVAIFGLPDDYYANFLDNIEALGLDVRAHSPFFAQQAQSVLSPLAT